MNDPPEPPDDGAAKGAVSADASAREGAAEPSSPSPPPPAAPEDAAPASPSAPRRARPPRASLREAPATAVLFLACVVVFVLAERDGDTTTSETLLAWGADWRGLVWQGEWWRLVTSMFLHIGFIHIAWNLYAGWALCAPVEKRMGTKRYLPLYLGSGVVAAAFSVLGHDAVGAGASGAMFGVIGARLAMDRLELGNWKSVYAKQPRDMVTIAIWLAIGPSMGFDNWAHGGGLIAGAAFAWVLYQPLQWRSRIAAGVAVAMVPLSLVPQFDMRQPSDVAVVVASHEKAGRWPEVIAVLDQFEQSRDFPKWERWADDERMKAYAALETPDAALDWARHRVELEPTAERHTTLAELLRKAGDSDAALVQLDLALAQDPKHVLAHFHRAYLRIAGGDGPGALADARAAVFEAPEDAACRLVLSLALAMNRDLANAEAEYALAQKLDPSHADLPLVRRTLDAVAAWDGGAIVEP